MLAMGPAATPLNRGFVLILTLQRPRLNHIQHNTALTHGQTKKVAAVRGLADRAQEPAHPKVCHVQLP